MTDTVENPIPTDPFGSAGVAPSGVLTISTDPGNAIIIGADGGIYVPDDSIDPLTYYLLSRS